MWVEFVVGTHPGSESFLRGSSVFLPLEKPTFLNAISNLTWKQWMKSLAADMPSAVNSHLFNNLLLARNFTIFVVVVVVVVEDHLVMKAELTGGSSPTSLFTLYILKIETHQINKQTSKLERVHKI